MILTDAQLEEIEKSLVIADPKSGGDYYLIRKPLAADLLDTIKHLKEEMRKARK